MGLNNTENTKVFYSFGVEEKELESQTFEKTKRTIM